MLIPILREADRDGVRVSDMVDDTWLVKTEGVLDNEHERTTWVEYRFPGSDVIVHRSAHVTLKKWPDGVGAVAGTIG